MPDFKLVNFGSLPILGNNPVYPIGAVSLASALRSEGHDVELVDFVERPGLLDDLSWLDAPCDFIGFSVRDIDPVDISRFSFVPAYTKFAARVQRRVNRAGYRPLYLGGGTGFTLFPRELARRLGVDVVVRGEGERAVIDLCANGNARVPDQTLEISSSDGDFPTRDVLHPPPLVEAYMRAGPLEAGVETRRRKCVKKCQYCPYAFINDGALGEFKSIPTLRTIINRLYETGVRRLFFTDAVFNNEIDAAKDVCRLLIDMALPDLEWSAYMVPSGFDEELAVLIKESGSGSLVFSPDSFDPRMMRVSGKLYGMKHVLRAREICRRVGIEAIWMLLFGSAGEDRETIARSAETANAVFDDDEVFINVGIRLLPGSPLARRLALVERDMIGPVFYPIDERTFDWILDAFEDRFFSNDRLLRITSWRASFKRMTRQPFDNPIDPHLDYLLLQDRQAN